MLAPADEHWHPSTKHPHWNESFYFNGFDHERGWACATRVGMTPQSGERDGFVCLFFPDQTTGFVRLSQTVGESGDEIAVEGLEALCSEPFRTWQVSYEGPIHHFDTPASDADLRRTADSSRPTKHLKLDLKIDALHAPFDFDKRTARLRPFGEWMHGAFSQNPLRALQRTARTLVALPAMMQAHHYEQSGAVRGTLEIDGQRSVIEGFGQRDHSWGVRDMRAPANWRWLSCQFGDDLSFNATQVDVLGMRVQGGFLLHDGVTEALASWRYQTTRATSSYWPDAINVVLTAKSGYQIELEAEVVTALPVIAETTREDVLVTASRAKYRRGDRTADGMVEFMEQLR